LYGSPCWVHAETVPQNCLQRTIPYSRHVMMNETECQDLTVMSIEITVFWDVSPHSLVNRHSTKVCEHLAMPIFRVEEENWLEKRVTLQLWKWS
jgi:hypothetical protein